MLNNDGLPEFESRFRQPQRLPAPARVSYLLDCDDCLMAVDDDFLAFARANDAPALTLDALLGRPLSAFISDPQTLRLNRMLLQHVRDRGTTLSVPFRCDADGLARDMRLQLTPLAAGRVRLIGQTISSTPVPALGLPRVAGNADQRGSTSLVHMCSWCNRFRLEPVGPDWLTIEELFGRHELLRHQRPPDVSHGICDDCHRAVLGAL